MLEVLSSGTGASKGLGSCPRVPSPTPLSTHTGRQEGASVGIKEALVPSPALPNPELLHEAIAGAVMGGQSHEQ